MQMNGEQVAAAVLADQGRKTKALTDSIGAAGINQLTAAIEVIAKHLRAAPAGTTSGDVLAGLKSARMPTPVYITDETHADLVAALAALDRDPAHPHPLRDRVIERLGEIGGVWPESVRQS